MADARDRLKAHRRNARHAAVRLRVLVAAPEQTTRSRYGRVFRSKGCDVIEVTNGCDALVQALVCRPDVILVDGAIALLSAPALCAILRRESATGDVPIVALLQDPTSTAALGLRRAGVNSVLVSSSPVAAIVSELFRLAASHAPRSDQSSPSDAPPGQAARPA